MLTKEVLKKEKWKVVDTSNGWESDQRHETVESAELELERDRTAFFSELSNRQGFSYRKTIVPADLEWFYDYRIREWVWG